MKKYVFEAAKKQLDRTTESLYEFCPPATITICAAKKNDALKKAKAALHDKYVGTGFVLGEVKLVSENDLPVDWNYGYGDKRGKGTAKDKAALYAANK